MSKLGSGLLRLLLLLLALAALTAGELQWRVCDEDAAPFRPTAVSIKPDPPVIGADVEFSIQGVSDTVVSSGTLDIGVSFQGMDIFSGSEDLCGRTSCPIAPGPLRIAVQQYLPPIAPPGDYEVTVKAVSGDDGSELMCVVLDFTMIPPSSAAAEAAAASSLASAADVAAASRSRPQTMVGRAKQPADDGPRFREAFRQAVQQRREQRQQQQQQHTRRHQLGGRGNGEQA